MKIKINQLSALYISLALLTLLSTTACEDIVEINPTNAEPRMVVNGRITPFQGQNWVRLNKSQAYFERGESPVISGATVVLEDDAGRVDTLVESAQTPGLYPIEQPGEIGRVYALSIITPEGEHFRSDPERLTEAPPIDTATYYVEPATEADEEDEYFVLLTATDNAGTRDFYRWRYSINDTIVTDPEELSFSNDNFLDGNQVRDFQLNFEPFRQGDTIRVEQLTITEDHFLYLNLVFNQTAFRGGLFDTPPAPIRGNVRSVDDGNIYALGYFYAAGMAEKTLVME